MILITDIKYRKVDKPFVEIAKIGPYEPVRMTDENAEPVTMEARAVQSEYIKSRIFTRHGQEYVIGMDLDSQNLLGLQWEAFDNMEVEIQGLTETLLGLYKYRDKWVSLTNQPWYKRIWYALRVQN